MKQFIFTKLMQVKKIMQSLKRPILYSVFFTLFVIVTLLASPVSLKLDLSEGKAYSLSASSKKILHTINKPLVLKLFISSDLPTRLLPIKTDVLAFLNEYAKENGKIQIVTIDPKKDTKVLTESQDIGIQEIQFSQLEKDKYQVATAFLGLGVYYNDKKMSIPQLTDVANLEYNLTSIIIKLTKTKTASIGIIGDDTLYQQTNDPYLTLGSLLFQQYEISPISIETDTEINKKYDAVIVFDNRTKKYTDEEIKLLKTYLLGGGKILMFADGVWVTDNLSTSTAEHNLFSLLSDWGIFIEKDLILSSSAELINFGSANQQILTLYPFWFRTNNFTAKTGALSNIQALTFPWGSTVTLKKKNRITHSVLVQSPSISWIQKEPFKLNPQDIPEPSQKDIRSYPLIAKAVNAKGGEIIVIPSSRFVEDRYITQTGANVEFVFNLVDNFASGGLLSGVRSRSVIFHPLPSISDNQKDIFKYGMMFILPGLFLLYGIVRTLKQ